MDSVAAGAERSFDVADDATLPDLGSLTGVAAVEELPARLLETTYFDTPERHLASAGIMLSRATGGERPGWVLEAPAPDGGTEELRTPGLAAETVPEPLQEAVQLHIRGREPAAVAVARVERRVLELRGEAGGTLARLLDDSVTAKTLAPADTGQLLAWRTWTLRPAVKEDGLVEAAAKALKAAGGVPMDRRPELSRVLGDPAPNPVGPAHPPLRRRGPASRVVGARLREQLTELEFRDILTRADAPDSIHKLRVAMRRLRSALATFDPLFDPEQTEPVTTELKWIAGVLGEARDAEVVRGRLTAAVAAEPVELMMGPIAQRIDRDLAGVYSAARGRALEAMRSERYYALVDRLDAFISDPPWTPLAGEPAREVLRARVRRDFRRLRRRAAAAEGTADAETRAERLHEVRIAAKRVRYAAETLTPVYGRDAARFAEAAAKVQSVLGDHHDAVVLLPTLRRVGVEAHLDGENAFGYGRLHGLEQPGMAEMEAAYRAAWANISRKKLRRWLR